MSSSGWFPAPCWLSRLQAERRDGLAAHHREARRSRFARPEEPPIPSPGIHRDGVRSNSSSDATRCQHQERAPMSIRSCRRKWTHFSALGCCPLRPRLRGRPRRQRPDRALIAEPTILPARAASRQEPGILSATQRRGRALERTSGRSEPTTVRGRYRRRRGTSPPSGEQIPGSAWVDLDGAPPT